MNVNQLIKDTDKLEIPQWVWIDNSGVKKQISLYEAVRRGKPLPYQHLTRHAEAVRPAVLAHHEAQKNKTYTSAVYAEMYDLVERLFAEAFVRERLQAKPTPKKAISIKTTEVNTATFIQVKIYTPELENAVYRLSVTSPRGALDEETRAKFFARVDRLLRAANDNPLEFYRG